MSLALKPGSERAHTRALRSDDAFRVMTSVARFVSVTRPTNGTK
ncbi:hypothetical protein [Microbacterium sp. ZW T5_56]